MLVSFTVSNYRSFRDEITLDLRTPRRAAWRAKPWDGNVQSVAAVYGANGSGKTTLFRAIAAMSAQVRDSYRRSAVSSEPFAFDNHSADRPTDFSATFIAADGICYAYGFSILHGQVIEEWAERYTTARSTLLFVRSATGLKFGAALNGPNRAVAKTMGPTNLYLSAAAAADHGGLAPIFTWFKRQLRAFPAHGHDSMLGFITETLANDPARRDRLNGMLARSDLGLSGLEIEVREVSESDKSQFQRMHDLVRAMVGDEVEATMPSRVYRAFGTHISEGQHYRLAWDAESDGTQALLCHAFVIDEALRDGSTLIFDEIDTSLHPLMVRQLVHTFQDPELNPHQAQLIFTSHDVSEMEAGYEGGAQLSRNEVWVTEKDMTGVSTLIPLSDYAVRTTDNMARRYMSGRYGGIPNPAELVDPVLIGI
jgi:energy-coupling factor transporter ATP-binding protein EcfA2